MASAGSIQSAGKTISSSAAAHGKSDQYSALLTLYHRKLSEQKKYSADYHKLLNAPDGMIENSRRKLKNLDAAIICSRRPGYFSHYKNTDRVSPAEGKKELTLLAKKLQKLEDEVTKIQEEIAALRKSEGDCMNLPAVNTLS